MTRAEFLARVRERGAFATDAEVEAAVEATLAALGAALMDDERRVLAGALPAGLRPLLAGGAEKPATLPELIEGVRRHEGVRAARAVEHAQAVCSVIESAASDDVMTLLSRRVPDLVGGLFRVPEARPDRETIERTGSITSRDRSLAGGRPGSRHPVSESAAHRAQAHSVSASDDPHADTKLSSAPGLTQERESETLASGHPPRPDRPLSGR